MNHYLLTGSDWRLLDQKVCAERVSRGDILSDIIMEERLSFTELALKYFIDYIYICRAIVFSKWTAQLPKTWLLMRESTA